MSRALLIAAAIGWGAWCGFMKNEQLGLFLAITGSVVMALVDLLLGGSS